MTASQLQNRHVDVSYSTDRISLLRDEVFPDNVCIVTWPLTFGGSGCTQRKVLRVIRVHLHLKYKLNLANLPVVVSVSETQTLCCYTHRGSTGPAEHLLRTTPSSPAQYGRRANFVVIANGDGCALNGTAVAAVLLDQ